MPDLSEFLADRCPDCGVPVGHKHHIDCLVAICVMTGQQRILHDEDPPPLPADLPIDLDAHTCGEDVWAGLRHGVTEAVRHGLFVRPATVDDLPLTGWIPCPPENPAATPDLDRLARTGRWNLVRQMWDLAPEVTGRG